MVNNKYAWIIIITTGIFLFSVKKIYDKMNLYLYQNQILSLKNIQKNNDILKENSLQLQQIENLVENRNLNNDELLQDRKDVDTSVNNNTQISQNEKYKVVLRYENKKAKKVKLIGSFSAWKERDMKKVDSGIWEGELIIKEKGVYKYYFIVDGKKVLDPKAKKTSDWKYSIFEIK